MIYLKHTVEQKALFFIYIKEEINHASYYCLE